MNNFINTARTALVRLHLKISLYNCCQHLKRNYNEAWKLKHLNWLLTLDSRVILIALDHRVPIRLRDKLKLSLMNYKEFSEKSVISKKNYIKAPLFTHFQEMNKIKIFE
jgi:hypothetical protein